MIVVGGDNLIDMIQSGQDAMTVSFDGARGGSAFNTCVAAGRQGAEVGFITPVSTDSLGEFLASEFANSDVAMLAPRSDAPSSLAVVTLNDGQPSYQFYRNGTAERQIDVPMLTRLLPDGAQAFHLTSLAITDGQDAEDWTSFFITQHDNGLLTTLDPNVRGMLIFDRDAYLARLDRLFAAVDVLKLSDEDLEWISPDMPMMEAFDMLAKSSNAAMIILTKGGDGATVRIGDVQVDVPAATVDQLVDTVGAGDTFMGTVLAQLSSQNRLSRAAVAAMTADDMTALITRAAQAAAINCGRKGCNPPRLAELD